jgi:O-methyltransferase
MTSLAEDLTAQTVAALAAGGRRRIALIGASPSAVEVQSALVSHGWGADILGIFDPGASAPGLPGQRPWTELAEASADLLVVCADQLKDDLLRAYVTLTSDSSPFPHVIIAGLDHLSYRSTLYSDLDRPAMVPSYATGHPNTRIHLFQCLEAAAAAGIDGAVVELGAFKGGTTAWLAKVVRRLGLKSRVLAFDSWSGFPPRRSVLDLYTHPRCVFTDLDAVRSHLEPLGVELIEGDIAETAPTVLDGVPILLAFVDTDNYSGTRRALETIRPNLVPGGAVVFDHYWTTSDYIYTIGERIAGLEALGDSGFLQLHGTGVFVKLR